MNITRRRNNIYFCF